MSKSNTAITADLSDDELHMQIQSGLKKLSKLRKDLLGIKNELSNKVLKEVQACRNEVNNTLIDVGEINDVINNRK